MDYKKMYYSLFNSVSDTIDELEKETFGANAVLKLKQVQIGAEDRYLEISKNTGRTIDMKIVKDTINGKVG